METTSRLDETSLARACDFGVHLAQRLDVSLEAALDRLGAWLVDYQPIKRVPIDILELEREYPSSVRAAERFEEGAAVLCNAAG
jgi:hypothetical protein